MFGKDENGNWRVGPYWLRSSDISHGVTMEKVFTLYGYTGRWTEGEEEWQALAELTVYSGSGFSVYMETDDMENTRDFRVGVPGLAALLRLERAGVGRIQKSRRFGLSLFDSCLTFYGGSDPHVWSRDDPWYHRLTIDLHRLLFGKASYKEEPVGEPVSGYVAVDREAYPVTAQLKVSSWTYPRRMGLSRFVNNSISRVEVDCGKGIPIPGKGENSWDLGDDKIFEASVAANSLEEGMERLAEMVRDRRDRYGGEGWKPEREVEGDAG